VSDPKADLSPTDYGRWRALLDVIEHTESLALAAESAKKHCLPGGDLEYLTARATTLGNMAKFLRTKL